MDGFSMALGLFAGFHLVLADGHNQLQGQSKHVAKEVVEIFAEMGIDVTWSSAPSVPSSSARPTVIVAILAHSSRDWRLREGAMATVAREGADSPGSVFLFYPDVARAMDYRPARSSSIRDGRPSGVSWHVGVARVVTHEILHYFLPGASARHYGFIHGAPAGRFPPEPEARGQPRYPGGVAEQTSLNP